MVNGRRGVLGYWSHCPWGSKSPDAPALWCFYEESPREHHAIILEVRRHYDTKVYATRDGQDMDAGEQIYKVA